MSETIQCAACGHANPNGTIFCKNCGAVVEVPADPNEKTQAISGIDELLKQDRNAVTGRANHVVGADSADVEEEDEAAKTEAIDFSALMASGALDGLGIETPVSRSKPAQDPIVDRDDPANYEATQALDLSNFDPSKPMPGILDPEPEEEEEALDYAPTAAINVSEFEAAMRPRPPEPTAPAPKISSPPPKPKKKREATMLGMDMPKKRPSLPNVSTATPKEPEPPALGALKPSKPEPSASVQVSMDPPAPKPAPARPAPKPKPPVPQNLAPPKATGGGGGGGGLDLDFSGGGGGGGGFNTPPAEEKSKTGLYVGIGVVLFSIFCCCPLGVGGYLYGTDSPLLQEFIGTEGAESDDGEEAEGAEGAEDSEEGEEAGEEGGEEAKGDDGDDGDGDDGEKGDLSAEGIKKTVEKEGWTVVGEPTTTEVGGNQTIALVIKKEDRTGSITVVSLADEEAAKQAMAAAEIDPNAKFAAFGRSESTYITVAVQGAKPEAVELLKALTD